MLTSEILENLEARPKKFKLQDSDGLYIVIKADRKVLWRFKYVFGGKRRAIKGGEYPRVDLATARLWRDRARLALSANIDPGAGGLKVGKAINIDPDGTFEALTREWLSYARRGWSDSYAERVLKAFENDMFPDLGHIPIQLIDGPRLRATLKKVERRGALEPCRRFRSQCGSVFQFAIAEGKATIDPSLSIIDTLPKRDANNHRAVLKASELGEFLAKLPTKGSGKLTSCAIRWTLLTMVRTKETRYARYNELEGLGGNHPQWRIPASQMKTGIEHIVPLSSQAMRLLTEVKKLSGSSQYIFPSLLSGDGVIGPSRMIECIGRMGYGGKATIHGFRGLASTLLNEATRTDGTGELARLWESDWVERQLAHVESRQSRRAYNAAEWIGPRQRMMQWWGDWVDAQDGRPSYLSMACPVPYQFVY